DSHGDLWIAVVGLHPGIVRWNRSANRFERISDKTATVFHETASGDLWIGMQAAAGRLRDGKLEVFPLGPFLETGEVRDLLVDRAGRVWIATMRAGLFRCDRPSETTPRFR